MAEEDAPGDHMQTGGGEGRSSLPSTFIKLNDLDREGKGREPGSGCGETPEGDPQQRRAEQEHLSYPALAPVVFFYMKQTTRPRSWCLKLVCNPYPLPASHIPARKFKSQN
uniref:Uncharacterized protein n=1 Tax=Callorhinchus milii TaxID=7868 RepID=A0A4W3GRR8_CALMI